MFLASDATGPRGMVACVMDACLPFVPDSIETPRITMRSPMAGDEVFVNPAIVESWEALHAWVPWAANQIPTMQESREFLIRSRESYLARTNLQLLMFDKVDGKFLGSTGFHRMDWNVPRLEIGYWIRKSAEGQGLVTHAVSAMCDFAFGELAAERLDIYCNETNTRSRRVAERCGFTLEGQLRNYRRDPSGQLQNTFVYSRLRAERY